MRGQKTGLSSLLIALIPSAGIGGNPRPKSNKWKKPQQNVEANQYVIWLQGQDLFKTLQLVLGYEVVSRALNRRYLQQKFAIIIGYVDRNAITNID